MTSTAPALDSAGAISGSGSPTSSAWFETGGGSLLMGRFREFQQLVAQRRRDVESGRWLPESAAAVDVTPNGSSLGSAPQASPLDPAADTQDESSDTSSGSEPGVESTGEPLGIVANGLWTELVAWLDHQATEARQLGGRLGYEEFLQAQYAMAAFGDEIFLHETNWGASEAWTEHLLEAHLFGSHRAGEEIFERIDALLDNAGSASTDLARIYLSVLALGFQGQYRKQSSGDEILASYRNRLYFVIYNRQPQVLTGNERIFPPAYASTLDNIPEQRLPYLRPWIIVGLLLLVAWAAVSLPLWAELTSDLRDLVDGILRDSELRGSG